MAYLLTQYVVHYGTNKARFGLFISDMVDTSDIQGSTKSSAEFNDIFVNTARNNKKSEPMYKNPFLMELLVEPETIDDIEKKIARRYHSTVDNNDGFAIFSGVTNTFGQQIVDNNAFTVLNSPLKKESDDLYGSYHNNDIFDDEPSSGFF